MLKFPVTPELLFYSLGVFSSDIIRLDYRYIDTKKHWWSRKSLCFNMGKVLVCLIMFTIRYLSAKFKAKKLKRFRTIITVYWKIGGVEWINFQLVIIWSILRTCFSLVNKIFLYSSWIIFSKGQENSLKAYPQKNKIQVTEVKSWPKRKVILSCSSINKIKFNPNLFIRDI